MSTASTSDLPQAELDAAQNPNDLLGRGTVLGRYGVVRRVGSGGMATVFEARHLDLDKRVAIKVLHTSVTPGSTSWERFLREGRAASSLRHPHIIDVFDCGIWRGVPYLVMEYLEGETLASLIHPEQPLPVGHVADLLLPVLAAVDAVHGRGIVHRDLKPENVFLARVAHGMVHPKVLDFGISKVPVDASHAALTSSGVLLGTPYYMAPEQVRGDSSGDTRCDQYALGAVLYECVTGRRPVEAHTLVDLLSAIAAGDFDPPRAHRPDLPEDFEALVLRAMELDPEARFPSVAALGRALAPFASPGVRALWAPTLALEIRQVAATIETARPSGAAAPIARAATRDAETDPPEVRSDDATPHATWELDAARGALVPRSHRWVLAAGSLTLVGILAASLAVLVSTPAMRPGRTHGTRGAGAARDEGSGVRHGTSEEGGGLSQGVPVSPESLCPGRSSGPRGTPIATRVTGTSGTSTAPGAASPRAAATKLRPGLRPTRVGPPAPEPARSVLGRANGAIILR